ncbi:MAG: sodium-dependent transporter [Gammaproteobacteria bacterium]|jgi:NSS family neurotransmitter:Na+ symporter|nr:sodium-dependent transporter [Gammaproteobacteria bacterium]
MLDNQSKQSRSLWSSRFAFIMVTAGAAVGLGNIWKFPYMAGNNGGGVFVLAYLFFILLIGIPAMIAELLIGRRGRQNPVSTLATLAIEAKANPSWQGLGWLGAVTLLLVLSFYSVVAGWSVAYLFYAMKGIFVNASPDTIVNIWQNLLASPLELTLWHTLFMFLTMGVVALGVNAGIERASRWMMPGLFLILILLVIYAAIEGNFKEGINFLFAFRPEDLTSQAVIDALGQAFFSLATGAGCILIYGSYLSKQTNIVETVMIISVLDVLVAILSGLAIFPIVFSHGLTPESGPGLMFHVLPIAFSHMPASIIVGSLFFSLLLFAAWTSSISMGEPLVALLQERWKISRPRGSLYIGALAWVFGLASVFSFNIWQNVKILGRWGIFQILTDVPTNILLPIGAFLFCIFAGWVMKEPNVQEEFGGESPFIYLAWRFSIRYIAPVGILIVFIANFI